MRFSKRLRNPVIISFCLLGVAVLITQSTADPIVLQQVAGDGVQEVVSRARRPLPPPWRLVEDLVIGVEYGDEEYMIRGPRDFTLLGDGTIVILDDRPIQFRLYSGEGTFVRAFGEPGSGPTDMHGDFVIGRSVLRPAGGDRFETWSGWPTWLQTWDTAGNMVSVRTLEDRHPLRQGRGPRQLRVRGEDVYPLILRNRRTEQRENVWITDLLVTDWEGTHADTLRVTEHAPLRFESGWFLEMGGPMPMDQTLITRAGRLYVTSFEEDWVREIDRKSGKELLRFRWDHEPDSFTDFVLPDTVAPETVENVRLGFEAYKNLVSLMFIAEGPHEEVWVQRTQASRPGVPVTMVHPHDDGIWPTDIFAASGEYRGRMLLPFEPRTQKMVGDFLYAIGTTRDGAPALIRYRLEPAG